MAVIVPFLSGAKQINIDLAEAVVILRGDGRDKTTQVLQGEMNIVVTRPIHVFKVSIEFIGKSHSMWPEGIGAKKAKYYHEKILHKQELILQSFENNNGVLEAGIHRWPFQFILSNSLVETIEDEMSKVFYYLSATVHRVGRGATNPRCRRGLLLLRIPHWLTNDALVANALPTTSIVSERKLPSCDVNICIEKSSGVSGTPFPISFTIIPNVKHLFLESITVLLLEKKIYQLPEFQAKRVDYNEYKISLLSVMRLADPALFATTDSELDLKQMKRLLHVKNARIPLDDEPFLYRLNCGLPNCVNLNHGSTFSEINISHTLKIKIELLNQQNEIIKVNFETPITILDCRLKDDFNSLPTYEEASLSESVIESNSEQPTGFFVCPCYLEYKKNRQGTIKDWMKMRNEPSSISQSSDDSVPPPAYDTIDILKS